MYGKDVYQKKIVVPSFTTYFWNFIFFLLIISFIINGSFAGSNIYEKTFDPQTLALLYTISMGLLISFWISGSMSYIPSSFRMSYGETAESSKWDISSKVLVVVVYIHIVYGYWTIIVNHSELNQTNVVLDPSEDYFVRLMVVNLINTISSYSCALIIIKTFFYHKFDYPDKIVTQQVLKDVE